jgi:RHS repeat-associated protein
MSARGTTTSAYNGDGTLVSQAVGGVTTRYTQDLAAPLSQVLQTQVGASTRTDYLYGLNRLASLSGSTKTWYASDALGSVRRTVADAGTPLGIVNYDPWGTPESGSVPTFGFTGEVQDAGAGLVNLRARWYSTAKGTFTSVDPFAGSPEQPYSLNPYQYGYSDPVLNTDPSGRAVANDDGGGIGQAACRAIGWLWVVSYETNQGHCVPKPPLPSNELPRQPRPTSSDTDPDDWWRVPRADTTTILNPPVIGPWPQGGTRTGGRTLATCFLLGMLLAAPLAMSIPDISQPKSNNVVRVRHYRSDIQRLKRKMIINNSQAVLQDHIYIEYPITTGYDEQSILHTVRGFGIAHRWEGMPYAGFVEFNVDLRTWTMEPDIAVSYGNAMRIDLEAGSLPVNPKNPFLPDLKWKGIGFPLRDSENPQEAPVNPLFYDYKGQLIWP